MGNSNMVFQDRLPEGRLDYTKIVIDDMYDVLMNSNDPFPKTYTKVQKLEFIDKMLDYLTEKEDYEKCAGLRKMKNEIINGHINSKKKS